jgi:hypothetical protein
MVPPAQARYSSVGRLGVTCSRHFCASCAILSLKLLHAIMPPRPDKPRRPVLDDHKRTGKKLVPPFVYLLPPLHEISWRCQQVPEVLWIALVHRRFGDQRAVELLTALTRSTRNHATRARSPIFGTVTAYGQLSPDEAVHVRGDLEESGVLQALQEAIRPLVALYPECPLRILFEDGEQKVADVDLEVLSSTTALLLDRITREATMAQATLTWFGFDLDMLKVAPNLSLAEFPRIEEYPATEFSRQLAASIRAGLFMFFIEPHYPQAPTWPLYFWNRGLAISPCRFR